MAYLKELRRPCQLSFCSRQAMVALYNHRNEHYGDYCRRHGEQEKRRLKREEGQTR